MNFQISGLPLEPFAALFVLDDAALAQHGARRYVADAKPGFPCRVTLEEAEPGERLLLLNYVHQSADTPYRASHAIFVRESATRSASFIDAVPPALRARTLSVRAFDADGMMTGADLVAGPDLEGLVARLFADPGTAYLHAHYAKPGCFAARIDRALV
jgi:hypothetical protein